MIKDPKVYFRNKKIENLGISDVSMSCQRIDYFIRYLLDDLYIFEPLDIIEEKTIYIFNEFGFYIKIKKELKCIDISDEVYEQYFMSKVITISALETVLEEVFTKLGYVDYSVALKQLYIIPIPERTCFERYFIKNMDSV
jgi:hypothetical protein